MFKFWKALTYPFRKIIVAEFQHVLEISFNSDFFDQSLNCQ